MSMDILSRRMLTQVAKGKEIRGVALSQRVHPMNCFGDTARGKIIILITIANCRTRRGTTHQSLRVKLMVVPLMPLIIVLIMVIFLLLLLDVHLTITFGYLILLVCIMSTLIELCLVPMIRCRMEVLFRWARILLVKLLACALCRSRCLMGLFTH
jgi:hypothetical protein